MNIYKLTQFNLLSTIYLCCIQIVYFVISVLSMLTQANKSIYKSSTIVVPAKGSKDSKEFI